MSVSGQTIKPRSSTLSFSDQISSRLQRWVQRSVKKGRNDSKATSIKIRRQNKDVREDDVDIKKCQPVPASFPKDSRDTRTIQELEKALKDLINNCVTNTMVASSASNDKVKPSFPGDTVQSKAGKNIDQTNNNIDEVIRDLKETNVRGGGTDCSRQSVEAKGRETVGEYVSLLRADANGVSGDKETRVEHKPVARIRSSELEESELAKVVSKSETKGQEGQVVSLACQAKRSGINENADEDFNHSSLYSGTVGVNTSVGNVNNGLSTGNSFKQQHRRVIKIGLHGEDSGNSGEAEASGRHARKTTKKKKPPLRRIQSEGDAISISKKLSFKDRDVSEFAETCIRHAQKKRWSESSSVGSNSEPLCISEVSDDGVEADEQSSTSPKTDPQMPEVISPVESTSNDLTELASSYDEENHVKNSTVSTQKKTLSGRPSSLSFPLAESRTKRETRQSFFKQKDVSRSTDTSPSSPLTTVSPKFKKFPCQPVFYVPKPAAYSSSREEPKLGQGLFSKRVHSEHLI